MAMVYLFINTLKDYEASVLSSLKGMREVQWATPVQGRHDIIACLKCEDMEEMKNAISKKIRRFSGIVRTTTTIVAE
jgi:DNA-binding Lrp family transcriptional regulator